MNTHYPGAKLPSAGHSMTTPQVDEPPWPYMKQREAARTLGVTVLYLQGLANNPIPAFKSTGKSGGTVWYFQKEAIRRIVDLLRGTEGNPSTTPSPIGQTTEQATA